MAVCHNRKLLRYDGMTFFVFICFSEFCLPCFLLSFYRLISRILSALLTECIIVHLLLFVYNKLTFIFLEKVYGFCNLGANICKKLLFN